MAPGSYKLAATSPTSLVFGNPDLLELIFENLSQSKMFLLWAAMTSRSKTEPAFNILWREIASLWPLFRILPMLLKDDNGNYVSPMKSLLCNRSNQVRVEIDGCCSRWTHQPRAVLCSSHSISLFLFRKNRSILETSYKPSNELHRENQQTRSFLPTPQTFHSRRDVHYSVPDICPKPRVNHALHTYRATWNNFCLPSDYSCRSGGLDNFQPQGKIFWQHIQRPAPFSPSATAFHQLGRHYHPHEFPEAHRIVHDFSTVIEHISLRLPIFARPW